MAWNDLTTDGGNIRKRDRDYYIDRSIAVCDYCQKGNHGNCDGHTGKRVEHSLTRDKPDREIPKSERPVCACAAEGHPRGSTCCIEVRHDDWGHGSRCSKPAKGEAPIPWGSDEPQPVCGLHLSAHKRRAENEERRAEKSRLQTEKWQRERENERAAAESLERESDLLEEFGLHVKTDGKGNAVLPAEELIGLLMRVER